MEEFFKKELDKDDAKLSILEETCFVNIPEDGIKSECTELQGKGRGLDIYSIYVYSDL